MRHRLPFAALVLAGLLLTPLAAAAQPRVQVQVMVIHASKHGSEVDPALEPLTRQLSAFAFSSYKLIRVEKLDLRFSEKGSVELPGDRRLVVEPLRRDADGKLRVRLAIGDLLDTTYAIDAGGTLIVGGPKHGDGVLVLAVTQNAGA